MSYFARRIPECMGQLIPLKYGPKVALDYLEEAPNKFSVILIDTIPSKGGNLYTSRI